MDFTYNPNQIALLGEDPSLRGQNLADKLMNAVAEQLCAEDKKAVLTCSYAVKWFDKHPEYKGVIK